MTPTLRYGVTSSCGHGFLVGPAGERERARACERERGRERWERPVVQEYGVVYVCIVGGVVYVCIVCAVVSAAAVSGL